TRDGRVGPFKEGVFRMAVQFGYPIVPMSIVGAYEFSRKGSWMLYPSKIVVQMHETIETKGLSKDEVRALMARVHHILSRPIDEAYGMGENSVDRLNQSLPSEHQAMR